MKFQPIAEERPVSEAIITALAEGGVRYVLGMPGGLTGPLWRSLHGHPIIRAIQVREESIGSLMAEAYGRFTGQPAVVMGQGEWIAGNAGQGYMEALLGSSPVIILTEMSDGGLAVASRPLPGGHRRLRDLGCAHHSRGSDQTADGEPQPRSGRPAHPAGPQTRPDRPARPGGRGLPQQRPAGTGWGRRRCPGSIRPMPTCPSSLRSVDEEALDSVAQVHRAPPPAR